MDPLYCLYISISGNTRSFMQRLKEYALQLHTINADQDYPLIDLKEISDQSIPTREDRPFFVFVPTYLDGGNGFETGTTEVMTNSFGEYLVDGDNADLVMGVIGSGNKNFNEQYCLTARKYAEECNSKVIGDYELRGTDEDIERIYHQLVQVAKAYRNQ